MPPRIVTISDHVDCPTGFGVQHRLLACALARAGYEVHSLGLWDPRPLAAVPVDRGEPAAAQAASPIPHPAIYFTRYPGGLGVEDHRKAWRMYRDLLRPDLVVTLGDLEMFTHLNDAPHRPFAWCHWLPLDALPYPAAQHQRMLRYDHLVLMSHFALQLVRPHLEGRVPLHYIPHGVDTRLFRPHEDPLALRRRWGRRLGVELRPDDFLLIARDANQWRKQQPLLLQTLAKLPRDIKLILHCRPIAHPRANGWHLPRVAHILGVADRVIFTSPVRSAGLCPSSAREQPDASEGLRPEGRTTNTLTPAELAELDNAADLRVSATTGEGFGIITIEAMACGTPTLITDYTTSRELILGTADGGSRIPHDQTTNGAAPPDASIRTQHPAPRNQLDPFGPAGELLRPAAWTIEQRRHLFRPLIDTDELAARILALRADPARLARYAAAGIRRVLAAYTTQHVARAWAALVRTILTDP